MKSVSTNVIPLWIFVSLRPSLKYNLRSSWCNTYFVLSFRLGTNFSTLSTRSLSGASGYSLCLSCNSFGYSKSTSKMQGLDFQFVSVHPLKVFVRLWFAHCPSVEIVCVQIGDIDTCLVLIITFGMLTLI